MRWTARGLCTVWFARAERTRHDRTVSDPTDHVLDAIDNALRDNISPDAMRWTPDPPADDDHYQPRAASQVMDDLAPWLAAAQRFRPEQRTSECTAEELRAWLAEAERHSMASFDTPPNYSVFARLPEFPPCLGCGDVTYGPGVNSAATVDHAGMTVTFRPCGCRLTINDPPILDHIPAGTRTERYGRVVVPGLALHPDRPVDWARDALVRACGEKPHVVMVLDADAFYRLFSEHVEIGPEDLIAVAVFLRAIPGATGYVVIRPAPDLPDGYMPRTMLGRWESRAGFYTQPLFHLAGISGTATARATGRVEIREDGTVAEVYEVTADRRLGLLGTVPVWSSW